ncbi:glycosyltransferase [Nonlabens tegetincola]|uniref:glycosyltransferase n=1 Tax=Nonlabens tegetincola TaxID=323273 RepID=UPI000CF415F0|nr:glycosyltransferase [Nonlabens tegetincola]PQJ14069.1 glycosyl transferase family 1 [Nonlabens tegetincola]
MRFLVISDAHHLRNDGKLVAYAPYVKEMNLWFSKVDEVQIIAPTRYNKPLLTQPFDLQDIQVTSLRRLEFHRISMAVVSLLTMPYQLVVLCFAFAKADHIHLRCPGNLALLSCLVQILFPRKKKTVKYAGNWDPQARQPMAYRWQKLILSNTFLSKNITVLAYGNYVNQTKNIKPFFTASYYEKDKEPIVKRGYTGELNALFVGTLSENKRPLKVVQIVEDLRNEGVPVTLDIYGNGPLFESLNDYVKKNKLNPFIHLHGNQPLSSVTQAYKKAHFAFLLSRSEGWPKAVAEPMFWGCIPIATAVSCVPWMLTGDDNQTRGILIKELSNASEIIKEYLNRTNKLDEMSNNAANWSRQYTLDKFDYEIEKLL